MAKKSKNYCFIFIRTTERRTIDTFILIVEALFFAYRHEKKIFEISKKYTVKFHM